MSLGYAEKLSFREDLGGRLGDPEIFDDESEFAHKIDELAQLVQQANRIIAFTGAGISTSCGIPDFRGPKGVWTLQRAGLPLPKPKVSFAVAKPSLTHQALLALLKMGKLTYIVSQNVDGLHLRSGVPRHCLAELHGNCFAEQCRRCGIEYVRDFEMETVGFKFTGRKCSNPGCNGAKLRDKVLDWEDALPEDELRASEQHAKAADLAICLGTSLQITPACNLPLRTIRTYKDKPEAGKLAIINLQKTKHDNRAKESGGVVVYGKSDIVMEKLMQKLGIPIPPYIREDVVQVGHLQHRVKNTNKTSNSGVPVTLFVRSTHGGKYDMPMVKSVHFKFFVGGVAEAHVVSAPFATRRTLSAPGKCKVLVTLHLHDTADEDKRIFNIEYDLDVIEPETIDHEELKEVKFVSQVVNYGGLAENIDNDKDSKTAVNHQVEPSTDANKKPRLE